MNQTASDPAILRAVPNAWPVQVCWDHLIAYDEAAWLTGLTNTELQLDSWASRTATGRIVYCVFSGVPHEGMRKGGDLNGRVDLSHLEDRGSGDLGPSLGDRTVSVCEGR